MPLRSAALRQLEELTAFSHGALGHPESLGLLLDAAEGSGQQEALAELSFQAKFAHRTYGILRRVGAEAKEAAALHREFGQAVERARILLQALTVAMDPADRDTFTRRYLAMTPDAVNNLLALFHDLSWYKNWHIDHRTTPPRRPHRS